MCIKHSTIEVEGDCIDIVMNLAQIQCLDAAPSVGIVAKQPLFIDLGNCLWFLHLFTRLAS
jgi:hypothetical protein